MIKLFLHDKNIFFVLFVIVVIVYCKRCQTWQMLPTQNTFSLKIYYIIWEYN